MVTNGKIVFQSDRDGNLEIYEMNADGTNQTRITANTAADFEPVWSPDGTKLLFRSLRDGNGEVYVMNTNGSGQTDLTNNPATDAHASWSPSGAKIAFVSNRDGNFEIYVMNADGTGQTRLTVSAGTDERPDWQRVTITTADPMIPPPSGSGMGPGTGSGSGVRLASAGPAFDIRPPAESLPAAGTSPLLPILSFGLLSATYYGYRKRHRVRF